MTPHTPFNQASDRLRDRGLWQSTRRALLPAAVCLLAGGGSIAAQVQTLGIGPNALVSWNQCTRADMRMDFANLGEYGWGPGLENTSRFRMVEATLRETAYIHLSDLELQLLAGKLNNKNLEVEVVVRGLAAKKDYLCHDTNGTGAEGAIYGAAQIYERSFKRWLAKGGKVHYLVSDHALHHYLKDQVESEEACQWSYDQIVRNQAILLRTLKRLIEADPNHDSDISIEIGAMEGSFFFAVEYLGSYYEGFIPNDNSNGDFPIRFGKVMRDTMAALKEPLALARPAPQHWLHNLLDPYLEPILSSDQEQQLVLSDDALGFYDFDFAYEGAYVDGLSLTAGDIDNVHVFAGVEGEPLDFRRLLGQKAFFGNRNVDVGIIVNAHAGNVFGPAERCNDCEDPGDTCADDGYPDPEWTPEQRHDGAESALGRANRFLEIYHQHFEPGTHKYMFSWWHPLPDLTHLPYAEDQTHSNLRSNLNVIRSQLDFLSGL